MKKYKIYFAPLAILGALLIILGIFFGFRYLEMKSVSNFDECAAKGFPIMESYPAQCSTPDGRTFTQDIDNAGDPIQTIPSEIGLYYPRPNQAITSPLTVDGFAPGNWFWEGIFPVELHNATGEIVASSHAEVLDGSDWMAEEFVHFEATLEFEVSDIEGTLVLRKANPSGLPELDEILQTPVRFRSAQSQDSCVITGCSSQICSDSDQITDCAYHEEYACYQNATCERQSDGNCGWTMTDELQACLDT